MNAPINTGGPAFPQVETTVHIDGDGNSGYTPVSDVHSVGGMTLRDYFAAQAMQALIHSGATVQRHTAEGILSVPSRIAIPPLAYEYADGMLAAREVQS